MRLPLALLCSVILSSAFADVTFIHQIVSEDGRTGARSDTTQTRIIKEDRSRDEEMTIVSGPNGQVTADRSSITLTRLDLGRLQMINVKEKTFQELLFDDIRRQSKETVDRKAAAAESDPTHKITKAHMNVEPTDERETIGGFDCRKYVLTMRFDLMHRQTRAKSGARMENAIWTTTENELLANGRKQEEAFAVRLRDTLDLPSSTDREGELGVTAAAALVGAGEEELRQALARISKEMKKVTGYPIRTRVDWTLHQGTTTMKQPAFSVISELRSVSLAPASDEQFQIPAGFTKTQH
jgi:hypothetical protein